ncbi:MAG TPA: hypothetical protein VLL52_22040 [Anaerolineae bacterium]|nr:hypothetical protein [Anaerolineae bacterium]
MLLFISLVYVGLISLAVFFIYEEKPEQLTLTYTLKDIWPHSFDSLPSATIFSGPRIFKSPQNQLILVQTTYDEALDSNVFHLLIYEDSSWYDTNLDQMLMAKKPIRYTVDFMTNGELYIAYQEDAGEDIYFLRWRNNEWETAGLFSGNAKGWDTAIVNDTIYFIWEDTGTISLGKWEGTDQIENASLEFISTLQGTEPTFLRGFNQNVFVSSIDSFNRLRISQWESQWQTIGTFPADTQFDAIVSSSGEIYLAWIPITDKPEVIKWVPSEQEWQTIPSIIPPVNDNDGYYHGVWLELDNDDSLYVGYTFFARNNLFVAKLINDQWFYVQNSTAPDPNLLSFNEFAYYPRLVAVNNQVFVSWLGSVRNRGNGYKPGLLFGQEG